MSKLLVGTGTGGLNEFSLVEWFTNPVAETLLGESTFFTGLDVDPTTGKLYGAGSSLYLVNPTDGSYETIGTIRSATEDGILPSITFSPSGVLYGSDYDSDLGSFRLYTIDTNTAFATEVGIVPENARAIDFAPNGTLYGASFDLITIDPSNGSVLSNIGTLEVSSLPNDLDITSDGTIYAVDDDYDIDTEISTGLLYEINPFSASTTLIGSYPSDSSAIASIPDEDLSTFTFSDTTEITNNNELLSSLNTSAGDGSLRVNIDAYGSFGSLVEGDTSDAFYDPVDEIDEAGTMFESGVAFRFAGGPSRTFLTTGFIGDSGGLNNPGFLQKSTTNADSIFTIDSLNFSLNQTVQENVLETQRTGSTLIQTYTITNTGDQSVSFELVRYADGDLYFDDTLQDTGGRLFKNGQEILFETDSGENPETATTFVGITASGGNSLSPGRIEIDQYPGLRDRIIDGLQLDDTITGDGRDTNEFIETAPYDVTLALRNDFVLGPGESTQYITSTIFGSGLPKEVVPIPLPSPETEIIPVVIPDPESVSISRTPEISEPIACGLINGFEQDDRLFGTNNCETINGLEGNDILYGLSENDTVIGQAGNDQLYGNRNQDRVQGSEGDDLLYGGKGDDVVIGGTGNDTVYGDRGSDSVIGVETDAIAPGLGEIDILYGGNGEVTKGVDVFVLGDSLTAYYNSGNNSDVGLEDYALIEDYNLSEDIIQLHGDSNRYRLDIAPVGLPSGTAIYYQNDSQEEIIGIIDGVSNITLNESDFSFV